VRLRQLGQVAAEVWNGSTGRWQGKGQATGRPFAFETLGTSLEPPCGEILLPQSASIRPLSLPGPGPPFAIGWPAMPLGRTGDCLKRALAVMIFLRVLIESILEETHSNRYRHAVRPLASCRRLGGALED
jgi:hypothetical protein